MITISLNYGTIANNSNSKPFDDINEALWNLIYLRNQAPYVIARNENETLIEFEHGVIKYVEKTFKDWILDNVNRYSPIRNVLKL